MISFYPGRGQLRIGAPQVSSIWDQRIVRDPMLYSQNQDRLNNQFSTNSNSWNQSGNNLAIRTNPRSGAGFSNKNHSFEEDEPDCEECRRLREEAETAKFYHVSLSI